MEQGVEAESAQGLGSTKGSMAGIKNNKGKFIVLILYVIFVFAYPFYSLTPMAQNQLIGFVNSIVSPAADQLSRQYIDFLRNGSTTQAYSMMLLGTQATSPEDLNGLSAYLASTTDQMEIVGARYTSNTNASGTTTIYETDYQIQNNAPVEKYILARVQVEDTGSGPHILGIDTFASTQSLKNPWNFNFAGQWGYIFWALLVPLLIIYTSLRYLTKAKHPKWILFLVILFLTLYPNISAGNISFYFGVQGLMGKTGPWSPWVFATPIPFGAIYYWITRKKYEGDAADKTSIKQILPHEHEEVRVL